MTYHGDTWIWSAVSTKPQARKKEKFSLTDQRDAGRRYCESINADVAAELEVPGWSRDYHTLGDAVLASADSEMDAFRELNKALRERRVKRLVIWDLDRIGRTMSFALEVVGRVTRDCEGVIVTLFDGATLDAENALLAVLKAFKSEQDNKRLRDYRAKGMDKRLEDGRSTATVLPLFHRRIRNEKGKEIATVVNEDLRPLWTALGEVVCAGVPWDSVEQVLWDKYQFGEDGHPYRAERMRDFLMNPSFWGHAAKNNHRRNRRGTRQVGPWIWDASVEAPKPIVIHYNRRPAVYAGEWAELGDRVKEELWRRYRLEGKGTPHSTWRFHGLFVCDACGYSLNKHANKKSAYVYLRCETRWRPHIRPAGCTATTVLLRADEAQTYLDLHLRRKLNQQPDSIFDSAGDASALERRLREEQRLHASLSARMQRLVDELGDAPDAARPYFRGEIRTTSQEIDAAKGRIGHWEREMFATSSLRRARDDAFATIKKNGGAEWLWRQSDTVIHQYLSAALGDSQLVVKDGEIVGTIPARSPGILSTRAALRDTV